MGRVDRVLVDAVVVAAKGVKAGDGVVFDSADWRSPQEPEEGGRVFEARTQRDGKLELRFANRAVNFSRIRAGDLVWRTSDPDLDKVVRALPVHSQIVDVNAIARESAPLETTWTLRDRPVSVSVAGPILERAEQRTLTSEQLTQQLGRLGGTPYAMGKLELSIEGSPFAPVSVLNKLRRAAG